MSGEDEITLEDLEIALMVCARLVELYGEQCLPMFERAEREYANYYQRQAATERARQLATTGDLSSYRMAKSPS